MEATYPSAAYGMQMSSEQTMEFVILHEAGHQELGCATEACADTNAINHMDH
jgi:hypothetical protein